MPNFCQYVRKQTKLFYSSPNSFLITLEIIISKGNDNMYVSASLSYLMHLHINGGSLTGLAPINKNIYYVNIYARLSIKPFYCERTNSKMNLINKIISNRRDEIVPICVYIMKCTASCLYYKARLISKNKMNDSYA